MTASTAQAAGPTSPTVRRDASGAVHRLAGTVLPAVDAPVTPVGDLHDLVEVVRRGDVMVLSGAGVSTGSGIPDYRGPDGAFRRGHVPMQYAEFTADASARRRYWARGLVGYHRMLAASPGPAHAAVAALEGAGLLRTTVTQNVDSLHQAAGSRDVVELHGALGRVVCLDCAAVVPRPHFDRRLEAANPGFAERAAALSAARINPDGDAELPAEVLDGFVLVDCPVCEVGRLKPDVVFFGESVPRERVRRVQDALAAASSVLVLGSSLSVMSGYRFVRAAVRAGTPVAVVTRGPSRADADLVDGRDVRLDVAVETVLTALVEALVPGA